MLQWSDDYSIGVDVIDEQHKHLFEIGSEIYELLENYLALDKYDKIALIVQELADYTKYHFKTEEELMISRKYPRFLSHKVEHDDFMQKINELDLEDIDKDQDKHIREILVFVFDWILDHILKKDKLITA